ncbi:hypothetical protein AAFN86_22505 [Roseomonas sp. CAU 1739]
MGGLLAAALCMVAPASAQDLDPRISGPLMQLIQGAGIQCQAGNQQACTMVPQLQQAGNELIQAQYACQRGNPQACQIFQMGAQQVMVAYQQAFGGAMQPQAPMQQGQAYSQQQQNWDHQQRMMQQQNQFQQQQQQYQQQQRANDLQHQRFMDQLRR